MARMPVAEATIDDGVARALLAAQHPDLADLALERVAEGWDNVVWRLGDQWSLRLPRRAVVADLLDAEHRALRALAPDLPLAVPAPIRVGRPDPAVGFPFPWTVVAWFHGANALATPPADPERAAIDLGGFLAALHRPAAGWVSASPYGRGMPLATRDVVTRGRIEALAAAGRVDGDRVAAAWTEALAADGWDGPPLWVHGDLHPANLVVARTGTLAAVIDWADVTAGDPAVDLSVAWMLLPPSAHAAFRAAAGRDRAIDDATWARARGNALAHALAVLSNSDDRPDMAAMGRHTLHQVLAEHP